MDIQKMNKIAVVLIHGLTGNDETWVHSNGNSLKKLLKTSDKRIEEHCEFYEYNYYSKLIEFMDGIVAKYGSNLLSKIPFVPKKLSEKKNRKNKTISHLASGLETELRVRFNDHSEIILIGHSLGGLVAKKLILKRIEDGNLNNVTGYISIATPHHGSLKALFTKFSKNKHAKELEPLNEQTMNLDTEWMKNNQSHPDSLYLIALDDEVVLPHCAIPAGIDRSICYEINDEDHTSICKPEDITKTNFIIIKKFILDKITSMLEHAYLLDEKSTKLTLYEKEVFVIKLILADVDEGLIDSSKDSFFRAEIACRLHRKEAKVLEDIYDKIKFLYQQEYYRRRNGEITSSELVYKVHKEIKDNNDSALKMALKHFSFLEKIGMLHQLANKKESKVYWGESDIPETRYEV